MRVLDTDGNSSPWAPRERFEYQPTLVSPLTPVSTRRPTFTWEAIPGASAYQIWIGTRTGRIIESDLVGTSWTPSQDLPAGDIRWWIRAMESTNGGWSDVGLASVGGVTGGGPTSVLTPTGTTADTTPVFSWQAINGSSRYILHVQNLTTGGVVIREDNLTSTNFTPTTALTSGNFRVWVKAIGASGNFNDGTWSAPVDFTIAAVSEERASDTFAEGWTSLDDLLKTDDTAQRGQVAVTAVSSIGNIAMKAEPTHGQRDLPNPTDETGLSPVAADDSPELRLSLLWQQPLLQEWLLFEELL